MGQAPRVRTADRIRRSGVLQAELDQDGTTRTAGLDSVGEAAIKTLVVPLYRIREHALQFASVDDPVTVREVGEEQEVWSKGRHLGDIGPLYRLEVRSGGFWAGVVQGIRDNPLSVTVRLYGDVGT